MAADVCTFLVASEYRKASVLRQIQRASLKTREETFRPRPRSINNNRVPMVGTYHPGLPNIAVFCSVELQPLLLCSDKCKSLGDYLVHAKLNPTRRTGQRRKGPVRCGNRRCHVCEYLEPGDFELDCNSSNVVYFCLVKYVMYNTLVQLQ